MKRLCLFVLLSAIAASAQTLQVSQFDGKDTGQKLANAQKAA